MLCFPVFANLQTAFESHPNSFPLAPRFGRPFFSYTYKLQISQLLSFDIHANCRGVVGVSPIKNLKCYLKFPFPGRALPSLFSLFAPRAFDKPSVIKRFRTLSKNSRVYGISSHSGTQRSGLTACLHLFCPSAPLRPRSWYDFLAASILRLPSTPSVFREGHALPGRRSS